MDQNQIYNAVSGLSKPNPRRGCTEVDSIDNYKCTYNNVLVSIDPYEYEVIGNGLVLGDEQYEYSQNRFNVAMHSVRHGIVIAHPIKYTYRKFGDEDHQTTIEIQKGDDVFFPASVSENTSLIRCKKQYYLVIDYENLYLAKREKQTLTNSSMEITLKDKHYDVIMLNGYLLGTRVYDKVKASIELINQEVLNKKFAVVRFMGSIPIYRDKNACTGEGISIGDKVVLYNSGAEIMLENELHLKFDGVNMYRIFQRKNVMGIIYDSIE